MVLPTNLLSKLNRLVKHIPTADITEMHIQGQEGCGEDPNKATPIDGSYLMH